MSDMSHANAAFARDDCLWPEWRVSPRVRALVTTRNGGVSVAPYGGGRPGEGGLNLGLHTGDSLDAVRENRRRVLELTRMPAAAWLEQVHGADIQEAGAVIDRCSAGPVQADASVTDRPGAVCVVMVADCLPVLFCDEAGRAVGAAHAGWRGLAGGHRREDGRARRRARGRKHVRVACVPGSGDRALGVRSRRGCARCVRVGSRCHAARCNRCRVLCHAGARQVPRRYLCARALASRWRGYRGRARAWRHALHGDRARALLFLSTGTRDGAHGRDDLACRLTRGTFDLTRPLRGNPQRLFVLQA